ncbi:hypothetical protein [Kitasatospora sp. NPDC087315]|uniref:hypothetical protein n=1 Tax=Kitasatospora sp. NPDC087315 TaxID=3364069 RepID=UPI0038269A70
MTAGTTAAVRGRELVVLLEGRLQPPQTVRCLNGGGRECALWLGAVAKLAAVDAPNLVDRYPVDAVRAGRVAELIGRVGSAGDSYSRGRCEDQASFGQGSQCETDAAGIAVGARLLADELKAQWP